MCRHFFHDTSAMRACDTYENCANVTVHALSAEKCACNSSSGFGECKYGTP